MTTASDEYISALPYASAVIEISRLFDELEARVSQGHSEPFDGDLPEVPAAPQSGG